MHFYRAGDLDLRGDLLSIISDENRLWGPVGGVVGGR